MITITVSAATASRNLNRTPLTSFPAIIEQATEDFDLVLRNACRAALKKGLVSDPNDLLVVTAGLPFGTPGAANIIRVVPAAGPSCWDGICVVNYD